MRIEISLQDGLPIYRQIVNQVKYQIASGQLHSDEELPPIRALAEQLAVTPNTVVKAYALLQSEGLVYKRQGAGTYVSETESPLARKERRKILADRADALLADAARLGFSIDEVQQLIQARHDEMDRSSARSAQRR